MIGKTDLLAKYEKFKPVILYLLFGGLTTLVNIAVYALLFVCMGLSNVPSSVAAWLLAVLLAFITNKIWVFKSRTFSPKLILAECLSFFAFRLASGAIDVGIMYLAVDFMGWNAILWKVISNVIVVILNYIFSKFFVFKSLP